MADTDRIANGAGPVNYRDEWWRSVRETEPGQRYILLPRSRPSLGRLAWSFIVRAGELLAGIW